MARFVLAAATTFPRLKHALFCHARTKFGSLPALAMPLAMLRFRGVECRKPPFPPRRGRVVKHPDPPPDISRRGTNSDHQVVLGGIGRMVRIRTNVTRGGHLSDSRVPLRSMKGGFGWGRPTTFDPSRRSGSPLLPHWGTRTCGSDPLEGSKVTWSDPKATHLGEIHVVERTWTRPFEEKVRPSTRSAGWRRTSMDGNGNGRCANVAEVRGGPEVDHR